MMNGISKLNSAGHTLIELLVAMGLLAIVMPTLLSSLALSTQSNQRHERRQQAQAIMIEAQEALRAIRASGWANVASPGTYHPVYESEEWQLASGSGTQNGYTTTVVISTVRRSDISGEIIESGGWIDPSTMKVDISVSWQGDNALSIESSSFITRYLDNQQLIETTEAHFLAGTLTATAVTNTNGGEVILGAGGQGDWCKPNQFILDELDLPGSGAARDVEAIEGKAFTGTNAGSGTYAEISISNELPPVANIEALMTGYDTNDVYIDGSYAYVATQDVSRDVIIIDLSNNQEVGYFNDPDWIGSAQGVYVRGNVGYVTIGPRLHTFDLSQKTGSRSQLDSVQLEGGFFWFLAQGYRLQVVGDYAYVAVNIGSAELRLINIANPSDIRRAARADVNGEQGKEVFVNETGTRAYLATSASSSKRELFVINTGVSTSNKNNSSYYLPVLSSYEANGMSPRGIKVVPGNRAILVGEGGEEYQVLDTSNELNIVRCGGYNTDTGIFGVAAVLESDEDAYSYIVTASPSAEFKIIQGGPGASVAAEGWFESNILDTGHDSGFNYLDFDFQLPDVTVLEMQVSGADAVSGNCDLATFTYVGPDKTSNTFFNGASALPFDNDGFGYENPARCFRYRVHMTTGGGSNSPVLEQVELNYSP